METSSAAASASTSLGVLVPDVAVAGGGTAAGASSSSSASSNARRRSCSDFSSLRKEVSALLELERGGDGPDRFRHRSQPVHNTIESVLTRLPCCSVRGLLLLELLDVVEQFRVRAASFVSVRVMQGDGKGRT